MFHSTSVVGGDSCESRAPWGWIQHLPLLDQGHEEVWEGPRHQQWWVRDNVPQNRRVWHQWSLTSVIFDTRVTIRPLWQDTQTKNVKFTGPVPAPPAQSPKTSGLDWVLWLVWLHRDQTNQQWQRCFECNWLLSPPLLLTAFSITHISNFQNC